MTLVDALASMPRTALIDAPTPIQPLKRIEELMGPALNGIKLYAKRDDLLGLAEFEIQASVSPLWGGRARVPRG